jgi:hypothetical protein
MVSKNYPNKEIDMIELITELLDFFETRNYRILRKDGLAGGIILDALKFGKPRDWLGLSLSLTIRLTSGSEVTRIWIGNQRWIDKIVVGFIGIIFFVALGSITISCFNFDLLQLSYFLLKMFSVLLVILPLIGSYLQYKVTQDTWNIIENHLALRSTPNA